MIARPVGMFGNVRACRHTLPPGLHAEWMAALCGTCLDVRDDAGQLARAVTNTDAVAAGALARAVEDGSADTTRAGPCPGRAMRTADVHRSSPGAGFGAAVSLLAAETALADDLDDGDVPGGRPGRAVARRMVTRLSTDATRLAAGAGIDVDAFRRATARAREAEVDRSSDLTAWTEPVEDAYRIVFAPTGLPETGARIGRATLLADAVADLGDDERDGRANPILTGAVTLDDAADDVRRTAASVAADVEGVAPGSLAAALWGPCWTEGLDRSMAPTLGHTRCRSCAAPVAIGMLLAFGRRSSRDRERRHRQQHSESCWCCCDCCDCCFCLSCCDC